MQSQVDSEVQSVLDMLQIQNGLQLTFEIKISKQPGEGVLILPEGGSKTAFEICCEMCKFLMRQLF